MNHPICTELPVPAHIYLASHISSYITVSIEVCTYNILTEPGRNLMGKARRISIGKTAEVVPEVAPADHRTDYMRAAVITRDENIVVFQDIAKIISPAIAFKGVRAFFCPDSSAHSCHNQ